MQQIPCSEIEAMFRRGAERRSTAHARAMLFMRRQSRTRRDGTRRVTWLQRGLFAAIMRPHMRAPALALVVFHLATAASTFVAKVNAQGFAPAIPATPDPKDLVRAELVADVEALAPGRPFRLAVRLEMKDGWHVNWINPGDAGLAPGIEWRAPKGFKTTVMCWPYPERFPAGPLVIFGYAKELFLSTEVTPPSDLQPGTVLHFGAEVTWLACEEACVPGSASLSLELPAERSARPSSTWATRIDQWQERCPGPSGAWSVDASMGDRATVLLDLQTAEDAGVTLNSAFFYPYEPGIIEHAAPQPLSVLPGPRGRAAYQLRVELSRVNPQVPDRARGVLVMDTDRTRAIEVDVPVRSR